MTTHEELENLLPHLAAALKREITTLSFNAEELLVPTFVGFITFLESARESFKASGLGALFPLPEITEELSLVNADLDPDYNPTDAVDIYKKEAANKMVYHAVRGVLLSSGNAA